MFSQPKGRRMEATASSTALPVVDPETVEIGMYLADVLHGQLYQVLDRRRMIRDSRRIRVAMLENVVTEEIEQWEFSRLAGLRVVRDAPVSEN